MDCKELTQRLAERGLLEVVDGLARSHYVTRADVLGPARTKAVARARKAVYRALRSYGLSYPEIGWLVGRDHSTVLAACKGMAEEAAQ